MQGRLEVGALARHKLYERAIVQASRTTIMDYDRAVKTIVLEEIAVRLPALGLHPSALSPSTSSCAK